MKFAAIFIIFGISQALGRIEISENGLEQTTHSNEETGLEEKIDTSCLPSSPPFTIFSQRVEQKILNVFQHIGFKFENAIMVLKFFKMQELVLKNEYCGLVQDGQYPIEIPTTECGKCTTFLLIMEAAEMDIETSFVRDFARDLKQMFCNDFNDLLLNEIGCNIPVEEMVPKIIKYFQSKFTEFGSYVCHDYCPAKIKTRGFRSLTLNSSQARSTLRNVGKYLPDFTKLLGCKDGCKNCVNVFGIYYKCYD